VAAERLASIAELEAEVRELRRARAASVPPDGSPLPGGSPCSDVWPPDGGGGGGSDDEGGEEEEEDSEEAEAHRSEPFSLMRTLSLDSCMV